MTCQRTNWMWADDTRYQYPCWHNWGFQYLQNDELCARIVPYFGGRWYGKPCDDLYAYICEKGECALPFRSILFCRFSYVDY